MKKPLGRLACVVLAGAAITFAVAPAAMAQDETGTTTTATTTTADTPSTTETTPGTPTTSESPTSSAAESSSDVVTTTDARPPVVAGGERAKVAGKTTKPAEPADTSTSTVPPKKYDDNVGHGFIGLTGDGVLVIACAEGAPGDLATANLTVKAGPDQDEADGRYWNYDVSVVGDFQGSTSTFSWTCDGKPGQGSVEFAQTPPPTSSTTPTTPGSSTSSTSAAPSSTVVSSTSVTVGQTRPKAQVRYEPQGGIETGFGGMAGV